MRIKLLLLAMLICIFNFNTFATSAKVKHATVKGHAKVAGFLDAEYSKFNGDLTIISDKASLKDSVVTGILTLKSDKPTALLELSCHSKIGGVVFQGTPGLVKKSANSTIKGKVKNGTVQTWEPSVKCK